MVKYFFSIIEQKLFLDEPIIFYTHPFEKRLNVFEKVFEKIHCFKIPILTLSEFAEWWKKRLDVKWQVDEKDGVVLITSDNSDESIRWMASYPSGEKIILSTNQDKIKLDEKKDEIQLGINPHELRKKTLQMIKYDILGVIRKIKQ